MTLRNEEDGEGDRGRGLLVAPTAPKHHDGRTRRARRGNLTEALVVADLPEQLAPWLVQTDPRSTEQRDTFELYLYAEAPPSMQPALPSVNRERHYVLYLHDITEAVKAARSVSQ